VKAVIDTNVPVVANDRHGEFPECVARCADRLDAFTKTGVVVLDDRRRIVSEYLLNLRGTGQPGVGSAFLKWVLTNEYNPSRCCRVAITEADEDGQSFVEFPRDPRLHGFDPSDRKFIAVAMAHPERPPVLQALDSKWWGYRDILRENGVDVEFLCPSSIKQLHVRKRR
jgi:hypothetical protein